MTIRELSKCMRGRRSAPATAERSLEAMSDTVSVRAEKVTELPNLLSLSKLYKDIQRKSTTVAALEKDG